MVGSFVVCLLWNTLAASAIAYELPTHFTFTLWLTEVAGLAQADGREIAKYDQATDDDPLTQPLWALDGSGQTRRADYHFPGRTRLLELQRRALRCTPGRVTQEQFKSMGQYLHALEDTYAHRSHDAAVGHLFSGHTPDKPWSHPAEFVTMAEAKFRALLELHTRCFRGSPNLEERERSFAQARALLETWRGQEYDAGTDDVDSPSRFEALTRSLYGRRFSEYVAEAGAYQEWLLRMKRGGWRIP